MTKKLLILGLLLTLVFTLNGCYSDDPSPFDDKATEVPISSFSESSEETTEETLEADVTETTQSQATETSTQEETEYSKDIAETSTTTVSTKTETPKSDDTEKVNKPEITTKPEENQQPTTQNEPEEKPKVEIVPNATSSDSKIVAQKVLEYINSYRSSPATKLSGLTEYAEYRSRQLIGNFAHDTDDERAAATALSYGEYVDPALYGMTGEPYYTAGAREAIAKAGYVGSIDSVAEKLALLVKNSSGHWAYVGSPEYSFIAVGVTYESGMWYCDIAMTKENTDNY